MISAKKELSSKQKHTEMLDGADHSVEIDFIRCIVTLGAGKGPREQSHWVL